MNYERINWTTGTKVKEGYTIINGQEYQTVQPEYSGETPINVENLNHMDEQLENVSYDYIVERGNDGTGWAWTKYKSGRVELTGWFQQTGINCTSQSAGTYYGGSKTNNLPFSITRLHLSLTNETSSRSSGVYVYSISFNGSNNIYTSITTEFRAHASTTNGNCGVYYYIIGYLPEE